MQATLIPVTYKKLNLGVRHISASLKKHGHDALIAFVRPDDPAPEDFFDERLARDLIEIAKDSALYGISLFTLDFPLACRITRFLKELDPGKPVVWGGMHAILDPEECLRHCDILCVEEGEKPLCRLLDAMSSGAGFSGIEGIWFKDNSGEIVRNPISGLVDDLDCLGAPDYSIEGKWGNKGGKLLPLDLDWIRESPQYFGSHLKGLLGEDSNLYTIMTSRGCPHRCSYCSNSYFLDKFKGNGKALRFRSVAHVIRELESVRSKFPFINGVAFYDDDFLARPLEDLRALAKEYKEKIGMPFSCMISPWSFNREKILLLIEAGLVHAQLGVQSGSERINKEVFNRNVATDKIVEVVNGLEALKADGLRSYLIDMIIENPYETLDDQYEALMFLRRIPPATKKQVFSLVFYPKTELTQRAIKDGFITEAEVMKGKLMGQRTKDLYSYYEFLVEFHKLLPKLIFKIMTVRIVFVMFKARIFNSLFYALRKLKVWLDNLIVKTIGQIG